ncbi:MAG TPA: hypothetical protein VGH54_17895 [Mycobacterium sp.]|jgi:hypothetical protein|uniref:hypothetical protein n=1 Tax=Mycobacterium sp. TaxID=1785 RepID=UPI002F41D234
MGIRLVSEVLDHYHGPDARKLWLLAWAEKANDRTRAGWPTREVLARRTGRSPSRVSHVADELVTEGVLKRDGGGNRSGPARFIMLTLDDAGKGASSAHPSGDGKDAGSAHPQAEVKGAPSAHPNEPGKSAAKAHPKPKIKGAESARKGAESGGKGADPSLLPAETGSLPLINPQQEQPSENLLAADADAPTAQTVLAAFIDWVRENGGELTERTIGTLARQIAALLRQPHISERSIRQGLADWFVASQHPGTLDSFVNAAANAEARARAAQNGQGARRPSQEATSSERARQAMDAGAEAAAILRKGIQQ